MATDPLHKSALQILGEKLAANLIEVMPTSVKTIPLGAQSLTPQQAVAAVQSGLDTMVAAENAKVASMAAVKARNDAEPAFRLLCSQLVSFLKLVITDPTELASCGVTPRKTPAKLTAAAAAQRSARNLATRAANGTQGKKQKAAAAKAAQGTTVVLGPDGQPLSSTPLPPGVTLTSTAATAPVSATPAANAPAANAPAANAPAPAVVAPAAGK